MTSAGIPQRARALIDFWFGPAGDAARETHRDIWFRSAPEHDAQLRELFLADYERAVHLKSDNVPALYQYGMALLDDGQLPEATATFDRVVQVSPHSPEGYYGRARVFAARGEGPGAAEALAEARKRVGADARAHLAEQGLKGAALDKATRDATDRSLAQMQNDPAFSRWAQDAGFQRTAWR